MFVGGSLNRRVGHEWLTLLMINTMIIIKAFIIFIVFEIIYAYTHPIYTIPNSKTQTLEKKGNNSTSVFKILVKAEKFKMHIFINYAYSYS